LLSAIYGALINHWATIHGLAVVSGLSIYLATSHTLHLRRHPTAAIGWVIALVLLPYAALPLYLIFGIRKVQGSRSATRQSELAPGEVSDALSSQTQMLASVMALPAAANYGQLNIHEDGTQALRSLRSMIDSAVRTIDLSTFIFAKDALGDELALRLKRRAQDGVRVRLLVDGIGAYLGGFPDFSGLSAAGVQVVFFVPPLRSTMRGRTNLRNHRKMVVTDGEWLWCGGRNLAVEYFEGDGKSGSKGQPWVDLSFDLHGASALQAQQQFEQDWAFATRSALPVPRTPVGHDSQSGAALGQLIASGPDQVDDTFYTILVSSFFNARKRILAVTPYFVPNTTLLMSMTLAARRGVRVDLLMPRKSNHLLADLSRHRALRELVAAGAQVWFLPHMIHAKAVVVDDELAMVGTANLDERSLFLNYELMVSFYDPADVRKYAEWIARRQESAEPYRVKPLSFWREIAEGLLLWLAFQL
jgi:cardiolipin synthase A/B